MMANRHDNNSSLDKSLNEHLCTIHEEIRQDIPAIARIAFALYDEPTGNLKTYADSNSAPLDSFLTHYEYPLDLLPSLKECSENGTIRHLDNIPEILHVDNQHNQWLLSQGFGSSLAAPTYSDDHFIGFIFFNAYESNSFRPEVLSHLLPYLDRIRKIATHEYELVHTVLDAVEYALKRVPKLHNQIRNHQHRVYYFTEFIAKGVADKYQLDDEVIDNITQFSRFHDIGKLSLPPKLLLKPTSLAAMERVQITDYIAKGVDIVDRIIDSSGQSSHSCLLILKEIISHHQEMLDGSGYPLGLVGEQIPISSRIITVANIFDALTSHRPYKQASSVPYALLELEKMVRANKIDAACVDALRDKQDFLHEIICRYPETDPKDIFV
jgi:HD-GYP domain-containing protein (c-di-GMP phosphodiesterase class II)